MNYDIRTTTNSYKIFQDGRCIAAATTKVLDGVSPREAAEQVVAWLPQITTDTTMRVPDYITKH